MLATGKADPAGTAGFTLIEMLVVLAVLGLVTGIVFPSVERALERSAKQQAVTQIIGAFAKARARAIQQGRSANLQIQPDGRGLRIAGSVDLPLPGSLKLTPQSGAVLFFADGGSTGGQFTLVDDRSSTRFSVDPVTGFAKIASR